MVEVILASSMGMCFGVRDALAITERIADPQDVTVHGQLVHNPAVLDQLRARGFRQSAELSRDVLPETRQVLITAHGISDAERHRLVMAGKQLIDTTCPLVSRVHREAQRLAAEGFHVLLIGKPGHVEVRGIVEDLPSYDIISAPDDVRTYESQQLGIVCQTTANPALVAEICAHVQLHNPMAEIRFIDTVCDPTRRRQQAMHALLDQVEAVVVVGGHNSNNTRELVAFCNKRQVPVLHIEGAGELDSGWLLRFTRIGLTAGTSTLAETISEVHTALLRLGAAKASVSTAEPALATAKKEPTP